MQVENPETPLHTEEPITLAGTDVPVRGLSRLRVAGGWIYDFPDGGKAFAPDVPRDEYKLVIPRATPGETGSAEGDLSRGPDDAPMCTLPAGRGLQKETWADGTPVVRPTDTSDVSVEWATWDAVIKQRNDLLVKYREVCEERDATQARLEAECRRVAVLESEGPTISQQTLHQDNQVLTAERNEARKDLEAAHAACSEQYDEIQSLRSACLAEQARNSECIRTIARLEEENAALRRDRQGSPRPAPQTLQGIADQLNAEIDLVTGLRNELGAAGGEIDRLTRLLDEAETALDVKHREIKELKGEVSVRGAKIVELVEQEDALRRRAETAEEAVRELRPRRDTGEGLTVPTEYGVAALEAFVADYVEVAPKAVQRFVMRYLRRMNLRPVTTADVIEKATSAAEPRDRT